MPNGNLDTEKYKQELMRLYSRSTSAEEKQVTEPVPEEINDTDTEAPDDTVYAEHTEEDSNGAEEDYNSRFPEPDLSELDTDLGTHSAEDDVPPVYDSDELLGTEKGYILVNVRTGDDSSAVAGAFISVTAIVDGKRLVLASGVTDESGVSPKFSLPVPDREYSQEPSPEERPYNLFDVSVSAEGFFRARSVDVPVFSGITSVQNFNLIPLPLMMDSSDETVTYYNAEPNFGGGKE
ncbi:carboxypeptidase-like regulatory domain-containing protein [Ruminococcus flavefaciens]|uniref:carboxypeptidase-like regulatory domain-containing protein n=1 Tax=Ruminococcus flavefaciens TaxID=1265 RepID=UPI0015649078|nr:carboxypeptidase-like regulatory domain-containing protein [Ruminococcus flavefaciens]